MMIKANVLLSTICMVLIISTVLFKYVFYIFTIKYFIDSFWLTIQIYQ